MTDDRELALRLARSVIDMDAEVADEEFLLCADDLAKIVREARGHECRAILAEWDKPWGLAPIRFIDRLEARAEELSK